MNAQLVFNLYPFSEHCYLPSANVIQTDREGTLLHVLQKALPNTISAYGWTLNPVQERLLSTVEALQPKTSKPASNSPRPGPPYHWPGCCSTRPRGQLWKPISSGNWRAGSTTWCAIICS